MIHKSVNPSMENKKRDPDLAVADIAMKRAARKAREKAKQMGTGVVVLKNGQIVENRQDTPSST